MMHQPLNLAEVEAAISEAVDTAVAKFGIAYVRQLSMFPSADWWKDNPRKLEIDDAK